MSEKRYELDVRMDMPKLLIDTATNERYNLLLVNDIEEIVGLLNGQQELIEELQVSDEMGWKRAKHFEKKCPKQLHNKKMYIKRLEYKVQKFKEMNSEQQNTIKVYEEGLTMKIKKINEQQATIEHLKKRLYDFEKRKIIEESDIDKDVIPKVKMLRTELFGEKYD